MEKLEAKYVSVGYVLVERVFLLTEVAGKNGQGLGLRVPRRSMIFYLSDEVF